MRLAYFAKKICRAWTDRTLISKAVGYLQRRAYVPLWTALTMATMARTDRTMPIARGFDDVAPANASSVRHHVARIVAAYQLAKAHERDAPKAFQVRGLWAEWIRINYQELIALLRAADVDALCLWFANVLRHPCVIGAGGNYDHMLAYKSGFMGRAFVRGVWTLNRDRYLSLGEPIEKVHQPIIGNPAGIYAAGNLIPINSFRDCHRALEIGRLLTDMPAATVVEIGGGVGWQGYQIMRLSSPPVSKYIDYDIPEVLAIASYVALHSIQGRRVSLYGEGGDYEVALYPHFAIVDMPEADMVFNQNSFSEMDGETARAYLHMVETRCRSYFRHINHEKRFVYRQADGSMSVNAIGSEMVPSGFTLLNKSPNTFHSPDDIGYVSWEYLYRRTV